MAFAGLPPLAVSAFQGLRLASSTDRLSVLLRASLYVSVLLRASLQANATIKEIQLHLEAFYRARDTPLARSGLKALATTMAGIYFIPFKTGASLQFSFSGQSIPNRVEVSAAKGIKIYFDAVETAARVEINKGLITSVFHEAASSTGVLAKFEPEAVEQLVYHVAAHEVGLLQPQPQP